MKGLTKNRRFIMACTVFLVVLAIFLITASAATAKPTKKNSKSAAPSQAPAQPQGVRAAAVDPGVCIDWLANTDPGVSGYYVYVMHNNNFKRLNNKPVTDNHYYHQDGVAGGEYAVTAVNADREESAYATAVAVTANPVVIYQESDPCISVEGPWTVEDLPGATDGRVRRASDAGSRLDFHFTGNQVRMYTAHNADCGMAHIYVDNDFYATVNTYSADPLYQQIEIDVPGLQYSEHVVTVLVLGYGNPTASGAEHNFVNIDAFEVR
jgi:hypothetical protein